MNKTLAQKYSESVSSFISYPTIPNWNNNCDTERWISTFKKRFDDENHLNGISIYIHMPFRESLCTYCGFNNNITVNHSVESEYISALEKEWLLYKKMMVQTPVIRELHIGGGTPTFFSAEMLEKIVTLITKGSIRHPRHEFSIEGHPKNTTPQHLAVLGKLGFKRISYGVQHNDSIGQKVMNRLLPLENIKIAIENARSTGFTSVNFDLIYGLPLQTVNSIKKTMNNVLRLQPDRIAFNSYSDMPKTSLSLSLFDENDLPTTEERLDIHAKGVELMLRAGYQEVGVDYFALPSDELFTVMNSGKLHRNFMGYTKHSSVLMLGLGVSAISDTGNSIVQNEKIIGNYYSAINSGQLPVKRGHFLSDLDEEMRRYISDIYCKGETQFSVRFRDVLNQYSFSKLKDMADDGLVAYNEYGVKITPVGKKFIRNICSAFDLFLKQYNNRDLFSKAI